MYNSDAYRLAGLSDVYRRWSDNEWKAAISSAAVSWSRLCGSRRREEMPALRSPQFPSGRFNVVVFGTVLE